MPWAASASTPFSDYCEGNICFQRKVNMACMTPDARKLLREISDRFGMIEVASACDGRHARRSAHYVGKAFDFRPYSAQRGDVIAFLKASPHVGGVGTYHNGLIHADVADRKMAWHGSGRGRVVWPIGAGTILKSPDDGPAAQASAFSFPFNLWGRQATPESQDRTVVAAAVPAGNGMDLAAATAASTTPPLPPRRPALLASLVAGQAADAAPGARPGDAAIAPSAFGEVGLAATPAPILDVSNSVALSGAPPGTGGVPAPTVTGPVPGFVAVGAESPAAQPAAKGFGADESPFTARAFTQPSQRGFSMAAYSPSLISPPRSPY